MKQLFDLLRRNWLYFLLVTLAALALRLFFVFAFPVVEGDSLIYGDIAKNWLSHGIFGVTDGETVRHTLIRLPGYPAFLAVLFSIFGREHYTAVMLVQAVIDTNTCLVVAAMALELMNERAAKAAYLLAALCPFTANYVALPLTETLAVFCAAHALFYGVCGIRRLEQGLPSTACWLLAGCWTGAGILLRPDGVLLLPPFGLALLVLMSRPGKRKPAAVAGLLLIVASLGPLVPWTIRNWHTMGVFQPLAPRYANDPDEFVPAGFNRWMRTWIVDYTSVAEVYWKVSGEAIDPAVLPERAFDSRREYETTQDLISRYNRTVYVDPQLDAEFTRLAQERVWNNPFRYYVWLPTLRITDMWLRPRTEMFPVSPRWWEARQHPGETVFAVTWSAINLFYIIAAFRGWRGWRLGLAGTVLVGFLLLRSAFLGTLENPEPRYVLECFPALLALAGGAFARPRQIKQGSGT